MRRRPPHVGRCKASSQTRPTRWATSRLQNGRSFRPHPLVLPRVDKEEDANEHECPDANSQPKQIQTHVQLNHAFVRVLRLFSRRRAMWSASLYVDDFGLW